MTAKAGAPTGTMAPGAYIGHPTGCRRRDMGLHAVVGRLVQLR
jgi:hypothetical protein